MNVVRRVERETFLREIVTYVAPLNTKIINVHLAVPRCSLAELMLRISRDSCEVLAVLNLLGRGLTVRILRCHLAQ